MKKYFFCCGACLFAFAGFSQTTMIGKVISEKTGEALPFVNIMLKNTTRGTTADVQGRFSVTVPAGGADFEFSFVGYASLVYHATPETAGLIIIRLKEKSTELHEVVIRPTVNPALRIIRKAVKNKKENDPENLPSFRYHVYNKLYLAMESTGDTARNEKERRYEKFAHQNHLFISESFTERKYVRPNLTKETVLANRVSGVKDPFFTFQASDFQPFSFYKDNVLLFNVNYRNPISYGSWDKYDFTLADTLYHGKDSVFVIAFEPLPGKSFEALKGQLYITTDGYALEHVLAQPADDQTLIEFHVQQQYEKTEGHWFPAQLNTELRFKEYKVGNQKTALRRPQLPQRRTHRGRHSKKGIRYAQRRVR